MAMMNPTDPMTLMGAHSMDQIDPYDLEQKDETGDVSLALSGPPNANGEIHAMDEGELQSILASEIANALSSLTSDSQIDNERRKALRFFFGKPLGNEVVGRSQVVLTEVADTIHWIMPSLLRMFASGEDVFEFNETRPEDKQMAEHATAYVNQVFWNEMDGFQVLYDWFFTALLEKNGFVYACWDERTEPKVETYQGLTQHELEALLDDGRNLEVVEFAEGEALQLPTPPFGPPDENGQPTEPQRPDPIPTFNVSLRQTKKLGRIKVQGIPPEEFLIRRDERVLTDETMFVAQRVKMSASDLIAKGFAPDEVMSWPFDATPEFAQNYVERRNEEASFPLTQNERRDAASRQLWVNNCYIRVDEDGDGYSELRHIQCIGDSSVKIIADEYANFVPFASLSASPVPHKFFGLSIYDLVGDLQVIRSTLMRQMLDNLYLANNQQMKVVTGQVMLDDLLTNRPGNIIRMDSLDSMEPLQFPTLGPVAMEMMNYLDQIRETRVGVSRSTQGLDASALNGTATGVNAMMSAGQSRVEMIGRIFAATGMKRLGKILLRMFRQYNNKARAVQLHGEWVEVNPSMWSEDMNISIKTGLGIGAAQDMIQNLIATIQLQKDALTNGAAMMVSPDDVYRAVAELNKAMGFKGADVFFTDPAGASWPAPAPEPQVLEHERRKVDDGNRHQLEMLRVQTEAGDKIAMAEFRKLELEQKKELALAEIEARVKIAQMQLDAAHEKSEKGMSGGED